MGLVRHQPRRCLDPERRGAGDLDEAGRRQFLADESGEGGSIAEVGCDRGQELVAPLTVTRIRGHAEERSNATVLTSEYVSISGITPIGVQRNRSKRLLASIARLGLGGGGPPRIVARPTLPCRGGHRKHGTRGDGVTYR